MVVDVSQILAKLDEVVVQEAKERKRRQRWLRFSASGSRLVACSSVDLAPNDRSSFLFFFFVQTRHMKPENILCVCAPFFLLCRRLHEKKAKRQAHAIGDANWDKPRRKTASASTKAAVTIRSNDRLVDKQREHNKAHWQGHAALRGDALGKALVPFNGTDNGGG